jgi:hypothetical protein
MAIRLGDEAPDFTAESASMSGSEIAGRFSFPTQLTIRLCARLNWAQ